MKKTFMIPALAAIAGLVWAFTMSAFKSEPVKESKKFDTHYFQFSGTNSETQYEDSTKWIVLPAVPDSDPCPGANSYVCVMRTADLATGTRTALVNYLQGLSSAKDYCNETERVEWKRETP